MGGVCAFHHYTYRLHEKVFGSEVLLSLLMSLIRKLNFVNYAERQGDTETETSTFDIQLHRHESKYKFNFYSMFVIQNLLNEIKYKLDNIKLFSSYMYFI